MTEFLRQKNFEKFNSLPNVDIIDGEASFVDNTTVQIKTAAGRKTVRGEKIFINTGSAPVIPPIDGATGNSKVFLSDSLMASDILPERLTIIGGGYVGLEFASLYANFGSRVTVIQSGGAFIPKEDRDIAEAIEASFKRRGIEIIDSAAVRSIAADGTVYYSVGNIEHNLPSDAVLLATGRRANIQGLNLEKAGVSVTERGAVQTDDYLKTTAPNIWAMGDVIGGPQFTYISLDDFRIVKAQLEGGSSDKSLANRRNVPYSVFLSPALSRTGLTEEEAVKAGYRVKIAKLAAVAIPKAQVLKQTEGLLKAVVDADTGKILGASLFCEQSYEMINIVKLAMDLGADYTVLRDNIFTHPTMSEALNDLFTAFD